MNYTEAHVRQAYDDGYAAGWQYALEEAAADLESWPGNRASVTWRRVALWLKARAAA